MGFHRKEVKVELIAEYNIKSSPGWVPNLNEM